MYLYGQVPVTSASEVYPLLDRARHKRAVAKTQSNERSSRSHSVFQLRITGVNAVTEMKSHGVRLTLHDKALRKYCYFLIFTS
jgi:kinesin family protein C1